MTTAAAAHAPADDPPLTPEEAASWMELLANYERWISTLTLRRDGALVVRNELVARAEFMRAEIARASAGLATRAEAAR